MYYLYKNNVLLLAKCQTFLFLILWVVLKDQNGSLAQEHFPQKLHFPQLRKPTPINHFHPKHKPVYQEIIRPSHEDPRLTKHLLNEQPILHGHLEYPKTVYPPGYDVILRKIDLDNERNQEITSISGIVQDNHNQEELIQTVKTPSYTYDYSEPSSFFVNFTYSCGIVTKPDVCSKLKVPKLHDGAYIILSF